MAGFGAHTGQELLCCGAGAMDGTKWNSGPPVRCRCGRASASASATAAIAGGCNATPTANAEIDRARGRPGSGCARVRSHGHGDLPIRAGFDGLSSRPGGSGNLWAAAARFRYSLAAWCARDAGRGTGAGLFTFPVSSRALLSEARSRRDRVVCGCSCTWFL